MGEQRESKEMNEEEELDAMHDSVNIPLLTVDEFSSEVEPTTPTLYKKKKNGERKIWAWQHRDLTSQDMPTI